MSNPTFLSAVVTIILVALLAALAYIVQILRHALETAISGLRADAQDAKVLLATIEAELAVLRDIHGHIAQFEPLPWARRAPTCVEHQPLAASDSINGSAQ